MKGIIISFGVGFVGSTILRTVYRSAKSKRVRDFMIDVRNFIKLTHIILRVALFVPVVFPNFFPMNDLYLNSITLRLDYFFIGTMFLSFLGIRSNYLSFSWYP